MFYDKDTDEHITAAFFWGINCRQNAKMWWQLQELTRDSGWLLYMETDVAV